MKHKATLWPASILCFTFLSTIAKGDKDLDFKKIINSETFQKIEINPLVAIHKEGKPQNSVEKTFTPAQISEAKTKAREIYAMLMEGPVPDFKVNEIDVYLIQGRQGDVSARFRLAENGLLNVVDIKSYASVTKPNPEFLFRSEASEKLPEELFQDIFGRAPIGKKHVIVSNDSGRSIKWELELPNEVILNGLPPKATMSLAEGKTGGGGWYFDCGITPESSKFIVESIRDNPLEIEFDQAIATTFKAAQSLGLPIVPESPQVDLCYYFPPRQGDTKVWRAKSRPEIDGINPIFGIRVFFRSWTGNFGDPTISVGALIDPRTCEVLYLGDHAY